MNVLWRSFTAHEITPYDVYITFTKSKWPHFQQLSTAVLLWLSSVKLFLPFYLLSFYTNVIYN